MSVERLKPIGPEIWIADGDCVDFYGFAYPTRSVIIRLASGDVWFWSPIAYDEDLHRAISDIGPIKHLVSPNKIHHLFLGDWKKSVPDAEIWGPRSTIKKRKDLDFEAPLTDEAPSAWRDELDQFHFTGSFFLDEVVFFHRPSKTAILADLSENFSDRFLHDHWSWWQRPIARIWGIVEGKGYAPLEWRLSFVRKGHARLEKEKLLECDPEKVIMAHGTPALSGGADYLRTALQWL
ncbi:MAG: DUF4336 domain-containing protein [Parvularcula sp.]